MPALPCTRLGACWAARRPWVGRPVTQSHRGGHSMTDQAGQCRAGGIKSPTAGRWATGCLGSARQRGWGIVIPRPLPMRSLEASPEGKANKSKKQKNENQNCDPPALPSPLAGLYPPAANRQLSPACSLGSAKYCAATGGPPNGIHLSVRQSRLLDRGETAHCLPRPARPPDRSRVCQGRMGGGGARFLAGAVKPTPPAQTEQPQGP